MKTNFKVYPRKIHVYTRTALACDPADTFYQYAWSTNAHRTCREAVTAAQIKHPSKTFKASFAKD
jgi:hypothetical protein